ncbi:4731_t:CDS:2, partial [Racocetra persica]
YSLQDISNVVDIFDTVNFLCSKSIPIPQIYESYITTTLYGPPQVLLSSNKILYFFEYLDDESNLMTLMTNVLEYDIISNSWQLINTSGAVPSQRSEFTAVSTSDGRVIIYGGTRNMLAATPSLVVLNTSNYEWSVPSEINHVGPLTQHTSIIVNNYMIVACGINVTNNKSNDCIYKLDISDPLIYKWSLFSNTTNNFVLQKPNSTTLPTTLPTSSSSPDNSISNNSLFFGIGVGVGIGII